MDDGRWYLANIIFLLGSLVREVPGSIVVSSYDNDWVFATNSNLISEWLAMTGFSVSCRELLLCLTLSGNGVEIVPGGMPGYSDLYVYLNIEAVIGLVQ